MLKIIVIVSSREFNVGNIGNELFMIKFKSLLFTDCVLCTDEYTYGNEK